MNKVYLLGSRQTIDKSIQVVEINQVIRMEGYSYDKYVVYDITRDSWGIHYQLINLRTLNFDVSEIIRPLSQKFGIGMYYDENNIEFKTESEVAKLLKQANAQEMQERENELVVAKAIETGSFIAWKNCLRGILMINATGIRTIKIKVKSAKYKVISSISKFFNISIPR